MGRSKAAMADAALAVGTQLHKHEAEAAQTQLQFNRNVPAVPENLALRFSNPRPIVIEKLKTSSDQKNLAGGEDLSMRSSGIFSVVSEEKLKLAVQLAKRDIKRRHLEEQVKQQVLGDAINKPSLAQKSEHQRTEVFEGPVNKRSPKFPTWLKNRQKLNQPLKVEMTNSGAKVYLYTPGEQKPIPAGLDSLPTHDRGLDCKSSADKEADKNMQEVRRLQKELRSYVQKIEELSKKGRDREILDPDKEQQICIRRQKQAARSARMLYVLQQQVKEIQDDLEKLTPHKIKYSKKSQAVSRLAAAHRGAVRALQAFATHFTNQTEQQIPTHYKELGSLIRQLSLCSAKLEGDSLVSDIVIDILLQVEELESLLEKTQTPKKVKKCISASQDNPPRNAETFPARKQLISLKGEKPPLSLKGQHGQEPRKTPAARILLNDKRVANTSAVQKARGFVPLLHNKFRELNDPPTPEKSDALQGSLDALVTARAVKENPVPQSGPLKMKSVLLPGKSQRMQKSLRPRWAQPRGRHAQFRETTIAFQLKEKKQPVKESRTPSRPPNRSSPCASPKRSQTASPAPCADKATKAAPERLKPLLDKTQQVAANADIRCEKLMDDLLEDTAQGLWSMKQRERVQTETLPVADSHDLELMLLRMEEIERYQEAVRRRFTQITYSDSELLAQEDKTEQQSASVAKRPTSPHPIQITRSIGHTDPDADVLFEKHFDSNDPQNKEAEEKLQSGNDSLQPFTQNSLRNERCVSLSVPKHVLQSILDYNSRYERHLKLTSHEAIGSFNPWQIAESLAEQLTEEALYDVAAELQEVCEDYAEAIFTSEFLQPVQ